MAECMLSLKLQPKYRETNTEPPPQERTEAEALLQVEVSVLIQTGVFCAFVFSL